MPAGVADPDPRRGGNDLMNEQVPEPLMHACGAAGPLRLEVEAPDGSRELLTFSQPFVLVGRASHNDLVLDDNEVAGRHAYLQVIGGQLFCVDLDSPDGTHWDGGPRWSGWLTPGQAVRIGPFRLRLVDGTRETPGAVAEDPTARGVPSLGVLPEASLELSGGTASESEWRVDRLLTLAGRSPRCKLCLEGGGMPQFLFSLILTPAGLWAVALGPEGRRGFSPEESGFALLRHADILSVGRLRLKVNYDSPPLSLADAGESPNLVPATAPSQVLDSDVWSPALPRSEASRMVSEVLAPVLEQFNRMQENMLEQFQQVVLTMAQVFGDSQREQKEFVRRELDQLQELTRELHMLRSDLADLPARQDRHAAVPAKATERSRLRAPRPASLPGATSGRPEHPATLAQGASVTSAALPPDRQQMPTQEGQPLSRPSVEPGITSPDIHDWLAQRIQDIQAERQSRWRKLLQLLGMSG